MTGIHSCWLGFIRNHMSGNAIFVGNVLADPDANEFVTNTIDRNLICIGNTRPRSSATPAVTRMWSAGT